MNTTPDNPEHIQLENDVRKYLSGLGFLTDEATYHSVMNPKVKDRLSHIYTPTSLYIRGRADRIAVHTQYDIVFEWEAKTHTSKKYHDMTLEALPLCHHLAKIQLDVECLYVYRDSIVGYDCGFWVKDIPPIRVIMIPERWGRAKSDWFKDQFTRFWPETKIRTTPAYGGSGDPFVIIDQSIVAKLSHWQDCIRAKLSEGEF